MVEVHELKIFVAAAEEENFSAAARKLHLSQPAISFQIQALEQRLRVQLFQRVGRRIALTDAGRDLMPMARELINLSVQIDEAMSAQQGLVKGQLLIGCSTSPGQYVLPRLLGAFRQCYPAVQVSVEVLDHSAVEAGLIGQQIHYGILGSFSKKKELECWPFFCDELVLIVPANHPWASRAAIPAAELVTQDWILRERGAATRTQVEEGLARCGISSDELRVAMELGSVEAVEAAVEAGHGVSFVSRVAARHGLDMGTIKKVDVEGLAVEREIFLAHHRLRTCTSAQLRFKDYVDSPEGRAVLKECVG